MGQPHEIRPLNPEEAINGVLLNLDASEELIRLGVTPTEIAEGFEKGLERSLELLKSMVCYTVKDNRDIKEVTQAIKTSMESKQYGNEDFLADLVAKACISILPEQTSFNVDNVRVCKILGSGLLSSQVVQGMVFKRHVEGEITQAEDAKVAIYSCPVDILQTETKGKTTRTLSWKRPLYNRFFRYGVDQNCRRIDELQQRRGEPFGVAN